MYITVIVLLVVAIVGAFMFYRQSESYAYPASYATLDSIYSRPLFEPDVTKRCADGAYMYSSNPWLGAYCGSVPPELVASVGCGRAYSGRPVRLSYSPTSNVCCPKPECDHEVVMATGCC